MKFLYSRKLVGFYLLLLVPIAWLATRFDTYQIDGDAVAYMDIADLLHAHRWAGAVNAYWHPLYPACLALGQILFHPTRWNELGVYYTINFFIFLAQVVAMLLFTDAIIALRSRLNTSAIDHLLTKNTLRLLGLGLLVIASQRELSMGKVRPDALLQALLLAAFAMLLRALAEDNFRRAAFVFAPLMGLFFGLAYLTKSFAFLVMLLSVASLGLFQLWFRRRSFVQSAVVASAAVILFAAVGGPYIAALSHQKHRFDFGDSGSLNYAWFSAGVEKMHLEPGMTKGFATSSVHLIHPEKQVLASPGVYNFNDFPYGTYPPWFDTTYFNERIIPHLNLPVLISRDLRNVVLVFRYLLNHPEAWVLMALMLLFGARCNLRDLKSFWWPTLLLSLAMWCIYGLVNIEERYVTVAWFVMVLPLFAALSQPATAASEFKWQKPVAASMVIAFAFLAVFGSLRNALETRRYSSSWGRPHTWYSPEIFGAAKALQEIGVRPGDPIACTGEEACLLDHYWARLAGVRILTEIYMPNNENLLGQLQALPNRQVVYNTVKSEGAKVLVAYFNSTSNVDGVAHQNGWVRLGDTNFYAMPMNLAAVTR